MLTPYAFTQRMEGIFPTVTYHGRKLAAGARGLPIHLNRNKKRAELVNRFLNEIEFRNIVETGTYLGYSTRYFCDVGRRRGARVFSAELSDHYGHLAQRLLIGERNLRLFRTDSVTMLRAIRKELGAGPTFFYLDAHWNDYLPLRDELTSIDRASALVLIDDFKVPDDERFGYDTYKGQPICLELIADVLDGMSVFFPSYPASDELYRPRGFCFLTGSQTICRHLEGCPELRAYSA